MSIYKPGKKRAAFLLLNLIVFSGLLLIAATVPARPVKADTPPPVPTIVFSDDEQTVSVDYGSQSWTFYRPVISDWNYTSQDEIFWVATDGSDTNEGSEAAPFETISRGIEAASPGDIVYIKAGTYIEGLWIDKAGQPGKPIIISSAPDALGKVKITPSRQHVLDNPNGAVIRIGGLNASQYLWLNGLIIEGPKGRPEADEVNLGTHGIIWTGGSGYGTRLTNSIIYHSTLSGLKEADHGGSDILIEGNGVFANGTSGWDHGIYAPGDKFHINGNVIFNNSGYGIHSYANPEEQLITYNIVFGHSDNPGIFVGGSNNKIFNNVSFGNFVGFSYAGDNTIVKNNIFAFNKRWNGFHGSDVTVTDNIGDYNGYFPNVLYADPFEDYPLGGNEIYENPIFINAQQGDFRLNPDSPYIDRGTAVGLPFVGSAPDIGAFEKCFPTSANFPFRVYLPLVLSPPSLLPPPSPGPGPFCY